MSLGVTEGTDLDGNPRIVNAVVDMGAYEGPNQGFVVTDDSVEVPEGGTAIFAVSLAVPPPGEVVVTLAFLEGDSDISVEAGAQLDFGPEDYSLPKAVTLAAAEDADLTDGRATIQVSANSIPSTLVEAVEIDNEPVPAVIYVDQLAGGSGTGYTWQDAFLDLYDALALAAVTGGRVSQIWVAAGSYRPAEPDGDPLLSFDLVDGVELYGGFLGTAHPLGGETSLVERDPSANETILSGDLNGDDGPDFTNREDNSQNVATARLVGAAGVLDGFVVSGGSSAALLVEGGEPVIRQCVFRDNSGYYGGMGSRFSSPTLEDCLFEANDQTGFNTVAWSATVTNCTFREKIGRGARISSSDVQFTNCVWSGNGDSGLYQFSGRVSLLNCLFAGNMAEKGAGIYWYDSGGNHTVTNCVFFGNKATERGGAIYSPNADATITNCTFAYNTAQLDGGGIWKGGSSDLLVRNSILWANVDRTGATQTAQIPGNNGSVSVDYCNIEGLTGSLGGVGNIGSDPRFLDVAGPDETVGTTDDNLRLHLLSPCVDAGDNTVVPPDEPDLDDDGDTSEPTPVDADDNPRFRDVPEVADTGNGGPPIVDMGAFEAPVFQLIVAGEPVSVPEGGTSTFQVWLSSEPPEALDVSIVRSAGDVDIQVQSPTILHFEPEEIASGIGPEKGPAGIQAIGFGHDAAR
ncbi:MAG: right-handed parallel beta-helix repeat-containing protein, partial [Planctomycetes bacterium]|nr:right-handed parallel beta-helix repeat-containing protein [Planctomycetota bacterium]